MRTVGTFMEADWLLKSGPDTVLGRLQERLGLNLVIFFYPKPLWWSQVVGDTAPDAIGGQAAQLREAIAATRAKGIDAWFYLGTFAERHGQLLPEFNVVGIDGAPFVPKRRIADGWTTAYSFCPNNATLKARYGAVFQAAAREFEIDGLFIGHNRFAPPGNDFGNLFTCFCPHCERSAGELGYDFAAMRASLLAFREQLTGLGPTSSLDLATPIAAWRRFRGDLIARTIAGFRDAVRQVRPEVVVGQDSIPPSFAFLSGHDYGQLEGAQDYLCPNVAHPVLFVLYSLAQTAYALREANPRLSERDALQLVYDTYGYSGFGLPDSLSRLVGDLPAVEGPKDTDTSQIPFRDIVVSELQKGAALASRQVPLHTYLAFGKRDVTPDGARARVAAAKEAGYDGVILGANWGLGLEQLKGHIDAIGDLLVN